MEEVRRKKQRGRCAWNYKLYQEYEMRPPGKEEDEEKELKEEEEGRKM